MQKKGSRALSWYFSIYEIIAKNRIKNQDCDLTQVHALTVMVLCTSLLMWIYAIIGYFTFSTPVVFGVGILCSTIHLLAPILFRITSKANCVTNVVLLSGFIHMLTFGYHSGGIFSVGIKWFTVLPMLGGLVIGKRGLYTWASLTFAATIILVSLHLSGYEFPNLMSAAGHLWATIIFIFGMIYISTVLVLHFILTKNHADTLLNNQSRRIDDLLRVLFHDLANSLGRISIGVTIAQRQDNSQMTSRGLRVVAEASDSMIEITQNVRKMYAASKGKTKIDLEYVPLNDCIDYLAGIFQTELQKKNITLDYDAQKFKGFSVWVEPISFKNQVLANAMTNSIKFSEVGGTIIISVSPRDQNFFVLDIKDHGMGMPADLIKDLFNMNKKTNRAGTLGESGTGFGMHILKSFVEMYGGEVHIESQDSLPSWTTVKLVLKGQWK